MKKVWISMVTAVLICLGLTSISWGGIRLSLEYWNPAFTGVNDAIADEDVNDDGSMNENAPIMLSLDGKSVGSFVLNGEMDISPEAALGISWWQVTGNNSLAAYSDIGFWTYQDCPWHGYGEWQYGPIVGEIEDTLSYFDLYYSRRILDRPDFQLFGLAGWSFGSFKENEDFTYYYDNETTIDEETDPDDWYNIVQKENISAHGPMLGIKGRARLMGKRSLYLRWLATCALISGGATTERSEWCNYCEEVAFAAKRDLDLTVPVINAVLGFDYTLTDALSILLGYRVSYWKNLPPRIRSVEYDYYSVVDLKRDDVALQGLSLGIGLEFQ